MNKELFVEQFRSLAPSEDDFMGKGLRPSFVNQQIDRFKIQLKTTPKLKFISDDEIVNLLQTYDCSSIGIGMLSFDPEPEERDGYYQVGKVELDIIVINKITKEIEVRDYADLRHSIWKCARNSYHFLDSLIISADCLKKILLDTESGDDNDYLLTVVENCADKAGGGQYIDFYKMLLGYFD